ncbi:MAG: DUF3788 family protein [Terracidiphilus sp.]|jgi:Protein of unknown function (DUF3788)|nr:DUF3788 family protein [Terracidiphilus sp.]
MDIPNAFIGRADQPTDREVAAALGATATLWEQLVGWLATEKGVAEREWKSISPKYGWALRLKLKKRTIVYMGPCAGCFRVSFVLGERAVAAARQSGLPAAVTKALDEAPKYAEGTGVRLVVKKQKDLAGIRKLAGIKLDH